MDEIYYFPPEDQQKFSSLEELNDPNEFADLIEKNREEILNKGFLERKYNHD